MYQLLDIKQEKDKLTLTILLDTTKAGDSNYTVQHHAAIPHGQSVDTFLQSELTRISPQLQARLNFLNTPPYDTFAKWRNHQWS